MPGVVNTRRYPRRSFGGRATVEIRRPGADDVIAVPGTFESLSQQGAGLALDDAIPVALDPGSRVDLCFFSAARGRQSRAARVPARVAWTRRRDGQFRVGAEFLLETATAAEAELVRRLFDDQPIDELATDELAAGPAAAARGG